MPEQIIGKESKRPKHQILRELIGRTETPLSLWFVEDRLKTLQLVHQQPDLDAVKLYLADWGYNTPLSGNLPRMTREFSCCHSPIC